MFVAGWLADCGPGFIALTHFLAFLAGVGAYAVYCRVARRRAGAGQD